jgi:hypothetical protein
MPRSTINLAMCSLLCRDVEDVFVATAAVLHELCEHRDVLTCTNVPKVLAVWDSVNRVMHGRIKIEGQYLAQLETRKGSDAGAELATRRLISRKNQFLKLKTLADRVRAQTAAAGGDANALVSASAGPTGTMHGICVLRCCG